MQTEVHTMQSRPSRRGHNSGLTLVELMIVVLVIGVLASIETPNLAELIRKSNEGATKGNLGTIRSALTLYFGDSEGQYPSDISALTVGARYIAALPTAKIPSYHPDASAVTMAIASNDGAGWVYDNVSNDSNMGSVWVNCTHTDTKGSSWTTY
jgi:prepilin-type N-terminal cleavage/methylation domain-containing protein